MADTVKKVAYFALDVVDRPGMAACMLDMLADAGVNLLAFTGFPSGKKAQLDFVPEDAAKFKRLMTRAQIPVRPKKTGFLVQGKDRAGAVAAVLDKLAEANINVTAVDAVSAGGGRFGAILWVAAKDLARASRALKAT